MTKFKLLVLVKQMCNFDLVYSYMVIHLSYLSEVKHFHLLSYANKIQIIFT